VPPLFETEKVFRPIVRQYATPIADYLKSTYLQQVILPIELKGRIISCGFAFRKALRNDTRT